MGELGKMVHFCLWEKKEGMYSLICKMLTYTKIQKNPLSFGDLCIVRCVDCKIENLPNISISYTQSMSYPCLWPLPLIFCHCPYRLDQ